MQGRVCQAAALDVRIAVEREADYFAAYLLAPEEAIAFHLGRNRNWRGERTLLGWAEVIALEQMLGVSHRAMLIRLRETGWLSADEETQMREGVVRQAAGLGYGTELYRPTREKAILSDYAEKAQRALEMGLISPGRYGELLLEAGLADVVYGLEEAEADE